MHAVRHRYGLVKRTKTPACPTRMPTVPLRSAAPISRGSPASAMANTVTPDRHQPHEWNLHVELARCTRYLVHATVSDD